MSSSLSARPPSVSHVSSSVSCLDMKSHQGDVSVQTVSIIISLAALTQLCDGSNAVLLAHLPKSSSQTERRGRGGPDPPGGRGGQDYRHGRLE